MTTPLPILPPRIQIVDEDGVATPEFSRWLNRLNDRVGKADAPSNTELGASVDQTGYEETIPGTGDGVTDNSAQFSAKVSPTGSLVTSGNVRARYKQGGVYKFNSLQDVHPSISLEMTSRGGILLKPGNNLPATNADGAESALLRIVRDSPPSNQNLAWGFSLSGVNLDARGTTQLYQVHGIRVPNADPSKNPYDPDPDFTGNKDYVAGAYSYSDVVGFSGSGVVVEATNGRLDAMSFRALNNGLHGFDIGGNDVVMHGHWAAGGNGQFGVKAGSASGFLVTTGNIWGSAALRSTTCGAMWLNARKLFTVTGCEFNDWLRMDGGNGFWRGGQITGNVFAPFNECFSADGVAIDNTPGTDKRLQAAIGVVEYQSANFVGNGFYRTTTTKFATPNNVGGSLTGQFGTAFQYLYDVSSGAMVNCIDTISSAPNVKPWVNTDAGLPSYNDPTPYNAHNGGQVNYLMMDSYRCLTRIGAKGPVHSQIALGIAETDEINTAYAVEVGDRTQPAGVPYRNAAYGMWEFQNCVQYSDAAYDRHAYTGPGTFSRTVKAGQVVQRISLTGGTFTAGTITLPTDLNASQELVIIIAGQACTALSWAVTGAGSIGTSTVNPPAYSPGFLMARLWYERDINEWEFLSVTATTQGGALGRIDGTAAPVGVVGEQVSSKVGSGAAVSLTSATPTDITSITLSPGDWNVSGVIQFASSASVSPAPSIVKGGLSATSSTITSTDASAYASRGVNLGAIAVSTDFDSLQLGPSRVTVAAGTTQTIYLVGRSTFTGGAGAVVAFGNISAIRTC